MKESSQLEAPPTRPGRIAEERAAEILERAAAIDAKRNSEIEVEQLREAAADAGISAEAFEQALREHAGGGAERQRGRRGGKGGGTLPTQIGSAEVAHYAALLRDVMGDGQLTVAEAIEWKDEDGVTVAVTPRASTVTAAVSAEGRLRSKLMGVILPALIPLTFFFGIAFEEGEAIVAFMGALLALATSIAGTVFVHQREKKARRRETERLRRQLQRLLASEE